MSEKKISAYAKDGIEVTTTTWNKGHATVYGNVKTSFQFNLEDVMDLIVDNWDSFDQNVRIAFARKIRMLDDNDARKEMSKIVKEDDDEGFKW